MRVGAGQHGAKGARPAVGGHIPHRPACTTRSCATAAACFTASPPQSPKAQSAALPHYNKLTRKAVEEGGVQTPAHPRVLKVHGRQLGAALAPCNNPTSSHKRRRSADTSSPQSPQSTRWSARHRRHVRPGSPRLRDRRGKQRCARGSRVHSGEAQLCRPVIGRALHSNRRRRAAAASH